MYVYLSQLQHYNERWLKSFVFWRILRGAMLSVWPRAQHEKTQACTTLSTGLDVTCSVSPALPLGEVFVIWATRRTQRVPYDRRYSSSGSRAMEHDVWWSVWPKGGNLDWFCRRQRQLLQLPLEQKPLVRSNHGYEWFIRNCREKTRQTVATTNR